MAHKHVSYSYKGKDWKFVKREENVKGNFWNIGKDINHNFVSPNLECSSAAGTIPLSRTVAAGFEFPTVVRVAAVARISVSARL